MIENGKSLLSYTKQFLQVSQMLAVCVVEKIPARSQSVLQLLKQGVRVYRNSEQNPLSARQTQVYR